MTATPPNPPDGTVDESSTRIEDIAASSPQDERVAHLIERSIDVEELASAVNAQEAADAADTLEALDEEEAVDVLEQMDELPAANALAEMETPLAVGVLRDVIDEDTDYAGRLLSVMAPDDAADLLQAMSGELRERALAVLDLDAAAGLRRLIGYGEESAGGLMTTDYLALEPMMTVEAATEAVRTLGVDAGVQHLPVVEDARLAGIVGLRDLLIAPADQRIGDLMRRTVKAVRADLDREQVAREFDRYDYTMLPVVDLEDRLIGIVTVDDVIDIIRAEQTEDVQMTVGAGAVEAVYSPIGEKFKGRFPWLAASLVMTSFAAAALLIFREQIGERPILAFLAAVIAPIVGNAGHQSLAVTLRGIVLDEVRRERVVPLVVREAVAGLLIGVALGVVTGVVLGLLGPRFGSSWLLGVIAGGSLAIAMATGKLSGAAIPLLMRRIGADPAHASAIFLIMITDGISFTTFLTISAAVLPPAT